MDSLLGMFGIIGYNHVQPYIGRVYTGSYRAWQQLQDREKPSTTLLFEAIGGEDCGRSLKRGLG